MNESVFVITHRRSGTHWTIDAVRHNFPQVSLRFLVLDRLLRWHDRHLTLQQFQQRLEHQRGIVLLKTHSPPDLAPFKTDERTYRFVSGLLSESRVIYVYRDGRDVLVSLYFYMRHYDERMKTVSLSDFIRMPNHFDLPPGVEGRVDRVHYWKAHVEGWLAYPCDKLTISYEELHHDYEGVLQQVGDYLKTELDDVIKPIDLPRSLPAESFKPLVPVVRIIRAIRTKVWGPSRSSSVLPRKGAGGEWPRYLSDNDAAYFGAVAGNLLSRLDYEQAVVETEKDAT